MRILRPFRDRVAGGLDRRFGDVERQFAELRELLVDEQSRRVAAEMELERRIETVGNTIKFAGNEIKSSHDELKAVVRSIAMEESHNRRALWELRSAPDYGEPFIADEPLVTICVATTAERTDLLMERSLPSALNQTYRNIEVVVVGDCAGEPSRSAIARLNDSRVRFADLTAQFRHSNARRHWYAAATQPRNEGLRIAQGLWTTDLDDDDALKPDAIADLLEFAQSNRVEVAYGLMAQFSPDGNHETIGAFPPQFATPDWHETGHEYPPWQGTACAAALNHHGMKIFKREYVAAELGIPGDYFRLERMLRAGVTFGMLDQVVYDYYPSTLWNGRR